MTEAQGADVIGALSVIVFLLAALLVAQFGGRR